MQSSSTNSPLAVKDLCKRYGKVEVLKKLSLSVESEAVHGLVGLNGSGKTTTLECILGMLPFNSGEVRVLGHKPDRVWQARGAIVGIFDTPSLHPGLTVRQTLEHARILCDKPVRTPAEVEEQLGISRYSKYRIRQLSLGNRRRASIAQALLGQPDFVILDEPFNGLDAGGVDDVLRLIKRLNREEGTAFLLSSHQLPYLEQICSHMTILHKGEIALSGRVDELFADNPARLYVRCGEPEQASRLLRSMPELDVHQEHDGLLRLALRNISSAQINQRLVEAGVEVSELILERPSLSALFRDITDASASQGVK